MIDRGDVLKAAGTIAGRVRRTPLVPVRPGRAGQPAEILLKLENLQETGAFKIRGVLNRISALDADEKKRGVICATSGNHGLGVAAAARDEGLSALVIVPRVTPDFKIEKLRALGARVEIRGAGFHESYRWAGELARREGRTMLPGFDDPLIMAGQGTTALEIIADEPRCDLIVLPIGGGGLAGGVLAAVKTSRPEIRVIGVQAAGAPSMYRSRLRGRPVTLSRVATGAEGIAVKRPGRLCFELVQRYIDDIVLVEESGIEAARRFIAAETGTTAEGAGAVPVAALLDGRLPFTGRRPAFIVTGGNAPPDDRH